MKLAVIDSKNNKNRFIYLGKYESIKDIYEFLESYKGFFNTDCRFYIVDTEEEEIGKFIHPKNAMLINWKKKKSKDSKFLDKILKRMEKNISRGLDILHNI